jgi:hypothetical protein
MDRRFAIIGLIFMAVFVFSPCVFAVGWTPSESSSSSKDDSTSSGFGGDIYDIAVNKILKGPIGTVAGIAAICIGAVSAIKGQYMAAIPAALGGVALLKADSILHSMGLIF